MTIVRPPFLLDFASAYARVEYARLGFTQEVLDERESHWSELFGQHWLAVHSLCASFTGKTGVILLDLSLNNIKFDAV